MLVGQSGEPWSHRFYQFSQTTFSIKSIITGGVEQNELIENCKRLAIGFVSLSERNLQITMVSPRWVFEVTRRGGPSQRDIFANIFSLFDEVNLINLIYGTFVLNFSL